jgi:hypothetical protein
MVIMYICMYVCMHVRMHASCVRIIHMSVHKCVRMLVYNLRCDAHLLKCKNTFIYNGAKYRKEVYTEIKSSV